MLKLHIACRFYLQKDATLYDKVAGLLGDQGRPLARHLIASIEGEPISLDEGVMHGAVVAVDEGDRITPMQKKVAGIIVPPLLLHDAEGAR